MNDRGEMLVQPGEPEQQGERSVTSTGQRGERKGDGWLPYDHLQRLLDVVIAGWALLVLAPLLAAVTFAVWAKLGRPVLFRQTRAGRWGRPFDIYKFRTMTEERDEQGRLLPDDRRLPRFGRFLRSSSLDELPELLNVLRGDMSLVGPRPLHVRYVPRYDPFQARRLEVRPGLTGWAQVNGRNQLPWDERFRLDVWYVDNRSLALDLRILLLTVLAVAKRRGITWEGHATMPEFRGSAGPGDGRRSRRSDCGPGGR